MPGKTPLDQFIATQERSIANATGAFSTLLRNLTLAAKMIARQVNRAGLTDLMGETGGQNVQGERVQKLDEWSNDLMLRLLYSSNVVCAAGSEELEDPIMWPDRQYAPYVVLFDPLDGSSNIDVNVSVGTIFSIYRRLSPEGEAPGLPDLLQPGRNQVAAGYYIYGSSTMLVYTTGLGVNGFTLEPSLGEFFLSHPGIRLPERCTCFSLNDRDYAEWDPRFRAYVDELRTRNQQPEAAFTPRYIGSMVADVHRNLLKGGVFAYPGTLRKPEGKLRLLYEANPMGWVVEQAGGTASNGQQPVLQLVPQKLHQRTPIFLGNTAEVRRQEACWN